MMSSEEEKRIYGSLTTDIEKSVFKNNCEKEINVHGAFRNSLSNNKEILKRSYDCEEEEDLLTKYFLNACLPSSSSLSSSSSSSAVNNNKKVCIEEVNNSDLLESALLKANPFLVINAMKSVNTEFSYPPGSPDDFTCPETCEGCKLCDGVDHVERICMEQSFDDYSAEVDEGDIEYDEDVVVDTDDEHMEINYRDGCDDDEQVHIVQSSSDPRGENNWNPTGLSFWGLRNDLKPLCEEEKKKKEYLNTTCYNCCKPIHCDPCEKKKNNPSGKLSADIIKTFAMRTTLMELGVCKVFKCCYYIFMF